MGIRLPGATTGLFDPNMVKQLIEVEKIPIESAKRRREDVVAEKDEFSKVRDLVNGLDTTLNGLKNRTDFYKLKVESSHPDIIDGLVEGVALPGNEFEVKDWQKLKRSWPMVFLIKIEPVGFGFMLIERDDMDDFEVVIELVQTSRCR